MVGKFSIASAKQHNHWQRSRVAARTACSVCFRGPFDEHFKNFAELRQVKWPFDWSVLLFACCTV